MVRLNKTLNTDEIKDLKNYCRNALADAGLSADIFDVDQEIDRKLSYQENWEILREKMLELYGIEDDRNMKKRIEQDNLKFEETKKAKEKNRQKDLKSFIK